AGSAALDLNIVKQDDLAESVRNRVLNVVTPLLQSREGEFNFILSEKVSELDIEYDPEVLFKEGGLSPQRVVATSDGERRKPLRRGPRRSATSSRPVGSSKSLAD